MNFNKPELILSNFDAWMLRWKHYQSESDWDIEMNRQQQRQNSYKAGLVTLFGTSAYTCGRATIKRIFGPPHLYDIPAFDIAIKNACKNFMLKSWRYTPMGFGRLICTCVPTYIVVAGLEHYHEGQRLQAYLKQDTVFGEQCRRYVNTGKLEEFIGPRVIPVTSTA